MSRTEKKFNQLLQPAANTLSELLPASANRRNVLINLTSRSSSNATIITGSAPLVFNASTVNPVFSSATGIGLAGSANPFVRGIGISPSKNAFVVGNYQSNYQPGVLPFTASSSAITIGTNYGINLNGTTGWYQVDSSWDSSGIWGTSNSGPVLSPLMAIIDDTYAMSYFASSGNSESYYKSCWWTWNTTNVSNNSTAQGYNASPTNASHTRSASWTPYLVNTVKPGTTTSNPGVGCELWVYQGNAGVGNQAAGMRVLRNGVITTAFWSNTNTDSLQNGTNLGYFFSRMSYNSVYPVYAIANPTRASANSWHGVPSSGGTVGTNAILPSVADAKYGFRFVAATAGSTDAQEFLKGALSYPTGTATTYIEVDSDQPIRELKFSPDGTKLAAWMNRGHSNNVTLQVTQKVLTNNVATLTINLGNLSDHTYQVGESVTVSSVGSPFDGTYTITARTATTISYARTNANITSTTATGTVTVTKTGNLTMSAVVIYTRQNNGTWIETHQSGTNITGTPWQYGNSMAWDSTSTLLALATSSQVRVWSLGGATVSRSAVSSTGGWTVAAPNPSVTSMLAPTTGANTTTNAAWIVPTGTYLGSGSEVALCEFIPVSGSQDQLLIIRSDGNFSSQKTITSTSLGHTNRVANYSGTGTVSNYINTVAQSIAVTTGSVIQISNIVIEPNEILYLEPTVANAIDAVVYGIEIA